MGRNLIRAEMTPGPDDRLGVTGATPLAHSYWEDRGRAVLDRVLGSTESSLSPAGVAGV